MIFSTLLVISLVTVHRIWCGSRILIFGFHSTNHYKKKLKKNKKMTAATWEKNHGLWFFEKNWKLWVIFLTQWLITNNHHFIMNYRTFSHLGLQKKFFKVFRKTNLELWSNIISDQEFYLFLVSAPACYHYIKTAGCGSHML